MKIKSTLLVCILILFKSYWAISQEKKKTPLLNPSMWDEYPWNGQGGIKLSIGTHNQFFGEIAYMKSDLPKQTSKKHIKDYDYVFGNQNVFGGLEFTKTYNDFFLAPKFGYELNLFALSARVSSVNYFSFNHNNFDSRILLEPGLTLCGFLGVYYGYSIPLSKHENLTINRHRVTASLNYFDMWRNKYRKKK